MKYILALKGFRLKLMFSISGLFALFGLVPSAAKIVALPVETRKGNKAPSWTTSPLPSDVSMSCENIAARSGPMVIKKYQPPKLDPAAPRVMFVHGGGWITGGVNTLDHLCANVSRSAQCMIYSVDYRLAPETQFPGGLEDCYDALNWLATDPSLGPMPAGGIAVIGESAGANLAAALCVLNARRGGPAIRHQTLIYPCVDATLESPSMAGGPPGFQKKDVVQLIELYRGAVKATDPLISPMFAENHAALPPALIITADLDPIRDDGERYARCLTVAGVRAKWINYKGMPHGFFFTPRACSAAAEGIAEISATIAALSQGKHA